MLLVSCRLLLRRRSRFGAAGAAIEAHAVDGEVVDDGGVIDVRDVHGSGDVVDIAVVVERTALPVAAGITAADVAKSVVDAAIKADVGTPIAGVPEVGALAPAPIARRPQEARLRRQHPGARHPVIIL